MTTKWAATRETAVATGGQLSAESSSDKVCRLMSALGRPRRRPKLLDFNGLCNRKGIFQFHAEIPDGAVHFGVPK